MKFKLVAFLFSLLFISANANAWKFYWTPTGPVPMAVLGDNKTNCVAKGTQSGDIVVFESTLMIVKSVTAETTKCIRSNLPIEALLETNADSMLLEKKLPAITIPDSYQNKILTSEDNKNGHFLMAFNYNEAAAINLFVKNKSTVNLDVTKYSLHLLKTIENSDRLDFKFATSPEKVVINGVDAWKNQVSGINKVGDNRDPIVHFQTVFDGDSESVFLRQTTIEKNFLKLKSEFENTAKSIANIGTAKMMLNNDMSGNKIIQTAPAKKPVNKSSATKSDPSLDLAGKLETLKQLLDKGLITQKDFDSKKAEILKSF